MASFVVKGKVVEECGNVGLEGVDIVLVDTGMGSLLGVQMSIANSSPHGTFYVKTAYSWDVRVKLPLLYLSDSEPFETATAEGEYEVLAANDMLDRKPMHFEIWFVKEGFEVGVLGFDLRSLPKQNDTYTIECGTYPLRKKLGKVDSTVKCNNRK
tara:strand:- start:28 stop:492 length:465 start_codon:yes stop_codon:yes gene_type:complete